MTAIQDNVKARITKKSYFFDLYCQSYEETITVDNTAEGIYNLTIDFMVWKGHTVNTNAREEDTHWKLSGYSQLKALCNKFSIKISVFDEDFSQF